MLGSDPGTSSLTPGMGMKTSQVYSNWLGKSPLWWYNETIKSLPMKPYSKEGYMSFSFAIP